MKGLRTCTYRVSDLQKAKAWYSEAFGTQPYFDEAYYVGFDIEGFELGLLPEIERQGPGVGGATAYWGVDNLDAELSRFEGLGARLLAPKQDVGGGVLLATMLDPFGNEIGLIYNPNFTIVRTQA